MEIIEQFKKETAKNELAWFNELEEKYGDDMELKDIVNFGASKGFHFDLEGLESYLESDVDDLNEKLNNDEIPEEILETISGGATANCACRVLRSWFRGVC